MSDTDTIVYDTFLRKAGKHLIFKNKQVSIEEGARIASITVVAGTLRIAGRCKIGEITVFNPRLRDGSCAHGLWLGNATGEIGHISINESQRDMAKIGQGTHDLVIGSFFGRAIKLEDTDFPEGHPPHRDGIQCMHAHNVLIEHVDIQNLFPGATNGGLWLNPNKADDENVDENDPTLVSNFVVEGGSIIFPNAAIHLGACTGCGARNTTLQAKRPFRVDPTAVDVVDENNEKLVLS
jgi:hypothetical protein